MDWDEKRDGLPVHGSAMGDRSERERERRRTGCLPEGVGRRKGEASRGGWGRGMERDDSEV